MEARLDYSRLSPALFRSYLALNNAAASAGLEPSLLELVKMRASQINGCAYCIDMHSIDARANGESEQRLYLLNAWREAPFYTDRERAALAWTEALTLVSESHMPDDLYEETRRHFSEEELVNLSWAIVVINGWNRISIAFRSQPGAYEAPKKKPALTHASV
jgi:AhpD family alkylhydroperoxidase